MTSSDFNSIKTPADAVVFLQRLARDFEQRADFESSETSSDWDRLAELVDQSDRLGIEIA